MQASPEGPHGNYSRGSPDTAAIILAGGRGRRMGGAAKALVPLGGRSLLDHVLRRLESQASSIAISANDPAVTARWPLLADRHDDRRGPLAGLLAGMGWALTQHRIRRIVSLPVDCPFLPYDLVARLQARAEETGAEVVVAASGGVEHPTVALWDLALAEPLRAVVEVGADLSVRRFYQTRRVAICAFDGPGLDPFFNINTPADLARAADALRMGEDLEAVVPRDADERHADRLGLPHREQSGG
jgi:molybdopterin-guanine dinucleotide biosynthesis protein A